VSIYGPLILVCLAVSAGPLLGRLTGRSLAAYPVTLCVLGLTVAVPLSHLVHSAFWEARSTGIQFVKIALYYLLLVTALSSTADLRRFLGWLGGLIVVVALLAVLHYHGVLEFSSLTRLQQQEIDEQTGELREFARLRSVGIFNDPNDLSLLLVC